jgi:Tfp pilus assembly protein PilF
MDKAKGHLIPWTLCCIVLALLAARSGDQMRVWKNTETLAGQQLALDPAGATGHKILAPWLSSQHRDGEAEREFQAAIAALDQQPSPDGATWFDYGNLLLRQERYPQAIAEYQIAIPRLTISKRVLALNNLGIALYRTGDAANARRQFQAALQLRPDDQQAKGNLEMLNGN